VPDSAGLSTPRNAETVTDDDTISALCHACPRIPRLGRERACAAVPASRTHALGCITWGWGLGEGAGTSSPRLWDTVSLVTEYTLGGSLERWITPIEPVFLASIRRPRSRPATCKEIVSCMSRPAGDGGRTGARARCPRTEQFHSETMSVAVPAVRNHPASPARHWARVKRSRRAPRVQRMRRRDGIRGCPRTKSERRGHTKAAGYRNGGYPLWGAEASAISRRYGQSPLCGDRRGYSTPPGRLRGLSLIRRFIIFSVFDDLNTERGPPWLAVAGCLSARKRGFLAPKGRAQAVLLPAPVFDRSLRSCVRRGVKFIFRL